MILSLSVEPPRRSPVHDEGAKEQIRVVLDALRDSVGALAVGLFDDQRGLGASQAEPVSFWDAFPDLDLPCLKVDWADFYARLTAEGEARATCTCGREHRLSGSLLHTRWVVLVVAEGAPARPQAGLVASTLQILATLLPARRAPVSESWLGLGHPQDDASVRPGAGGPPVWWIRKPRA